jgi:Mrp family chromosome partitioning ATPase/predicted Fe-Mo cluster-binding NifX family protein
MGQHSPSTATGENDREVQQQRLRSRMERVRHKVLVLSGKGGVGKSTVAAHLAAALAARGRRVGLVDVDMHGPSIPKLLGLEGQAVGVLAGGMSPVAVGENLKVMSIGFLLQGSEDPVIWRGPLKMGAIRQFFSEVAWDDLDYLIVDSPPGTGDEPLSVVQLIENADGAVIVTTPQEVALADVRRCVGFCRQLSLPVLGIVENMSGFVCPACGASVDIFKKGGGEQMAREAGIPLLARIPLDPRIVDAGDSGRPLVGPEGETEAGRAFEPMVRAVIALDREKGGEDMRIAIPLENGKLSAHFGHCRSFAFFDVDPEEKTVLKQQVLEAPEHAPGLLPSWLGEHGVGLVIAGGMGRRAQGFFAESGVKVLTGAPAEAPDKIVGSYLEGTLVTGGNICDH